MDIIVGDKRVEIDVAKIMLAIDSALHNEITDKTGIIISHDTIVTAIAKTIREHNQEELRLWYDMEQYVERLEKTEKKIDDKIKRGKVVHGGNTFVGKFKYHILGYVDVGIRMSDDEAVMFVRDKRDNAE